MKAKFKEVNAVALKANYIDGAAGSEDILATMKAVGRPGFFPVYIVYPADPAKPHLEPLPEVLTPDIVIAALEEAAQK